MEVNKWSNWHKMCGEIRLDEYDVDKFWKEADEADKAKCYTAQDIGMVIANTVLKHPIYRYGDDIRMYYCEYRNGDWVNAGLRASLNGNPYYSYISLDDNDSYIIMPGDAVRKHLPDIEGQIKDRQDAIKKLSDDVVAQWESFMQALNDFCKFTAETLNTESCIQQTEKLVQDIKNTGKNGDDKMEEDIHRTYKRSKMQEDLSDYGEGFIGITEDEYEYCDSCMGYYNQYPYGYNDCIAISKSKMNTIADLLGEKHLGIGDDIDFYFEDEDPTDGTDETICINNYEIVDRRGDSYILQATGNDNLATNPYYEYDESLKRRSNRVSESYGKLSNTYKATRQGRLRK